MSATVRVDLDWTYRLRNPDRSYGPGDTEIPVMDAVRLGLVTEERALEIMSAPPPPPPRSRYHDLLAEYQALVKEGFLEAVQGTGSKGALTMADLIGALKLQDGPEGPEGSKAGGSDSPDPPGAPQHSPHA